MFTDFGPVLFLFCRRTDSETKCVFQKSFYRSISACDTFTVTSTLYFSTELISATPKVFRENQNFRIFMIGRRCSPRTTARRTTATLTYYESNDERKIKVPDGSLLGWIEKNSLIISAMMLIFIFFFFINTFF